MTKLTSALLLSAYAQGYFPMAKSRHAKTVEWYYPKERGVIPLDDFHIPKSLAKIARRQPYTLTMNRDFRAVITACANAPREGDGDTWINDEIIEAYCALHTLGHAHSVEVWETSPPPAGGRLGGGQACSGESWMPPPQPSPYGGGRLIGGLYGVSLGRAFFGESMFSLAPNASKLALVHLVAWLRAQGYTLLDTQYVNDHLQQFGVQAIAREEYLKRLAIALGVADSA